MSCPHPDSYVDEQADGWFCYFCDTHYYSDPRKGTLEQRIKDLEDAVASLRGQQRDDSSD